MYEQALVCLSNKYILPRRRGQHARRGRDAESKCSLGVFTLILSHTRIHLDTILPLPILYGVWHTEGGLAGRRVLQNRRAIVLQ